jgi:gliding motility-associated-like protein
MNKLNILLVLLFSSLVAKSQIVIDNNPPYDNPTWLVDNILLGGGVVASNHAYQGDVAQIGWFNAVNTNLGIDSGIVMCTGDIYALDPAVGGGAFFTNTVTDPDLLAVANSVPGMIGQSFTVSSVNDIAILEFDFIPTSDSLNFKYAFGSQEYFAYENTQYNDVFGFFLSGPGIIGPWTSPAGFPNGSVNLAVVPGTAPPLPITISSINSVTPINQQYFVDNQSGLSIIADADGFTTVLTARALVQCGETYHIRLAIADGTDGGLSSYVWLEAGSFYSPPLSIIDDLGLDSAVMSIPCNSTVTLTATGGVGATYQWFDSTSAVFSTNSSITVGEGIYVVSADISGCAVLSDTLRVIEGDSPIFDLGADTIIACNSSYLLTPNILGGTAPYVYQWFDSNSVVISTNSSITVGEGDYDLIVSDLFACGDTSSISITYDPPPLVDLGSDYSIACNTTTTLVPNIIGGTLPYSYEWNDGSINSSLVASEGNYSLTVSDFWNCSDLDNIEITESIPGTVTLSGGGSICDDGTTSIIDFDFNGLLPWNLEFTNGLSNQAIQGITSSNYLVTTSNEGTYDIVVASDVNDCLANIIGTAQVIVHPLPIANLSPIESFIYEGETIELEVGDFAMYQWYNAEGLNLDTLSTLTVSDSGTYYVWVTDINGCSDESDVAIVHTQPLTNLFIPNAFTPNGDDHNELFVIRGVNVNTFNIQIFNRWGELMFLSDSIDKSWDGTFDNKKVQEGTYYYNIKVLGDDNRMLELSGTISLIY